MSIDYKSYEFQVYEYLVRLQQELQKGILCPKTKELLRQVADEQERIKTRRFRVAVVGEFKKGKSCFINALLGQNVLPVDTSPTTATMNRITYGTVPRACLHYKDGSCQEVDIGSLSDYVTKLTEESKENASKIKEAVVEYPSIFCQNYVDLIDTPGMNDEESMNEVTIKGLDQIDLAIAIISANYPFSETECKFMVQLLENPAISQIIVVVTHIDMIHERERERLLSYIEQRIKKDVLERLKKFYPNEDPIFQKYERIFHHLNQFGVSSVEALEARETGDMELLRISGFSELNNRLPSIILSSQNNSVLLKVMDAVWRIIRAYTNNYSQMVLENKKLVGCMSKVREKFAGEGYRQVMLLMDNAREKMYACIDRFRQFMERELVNGFFNCLKSSENLDPAALHNRLMKQCDESYGQVLERIKGYLDPKLEHIYHEEAKESMGQFCGEMRERLKGFEDCFDRQQEEFTRLYYDWQALGLGKSSVLFEWTDALVPDRPELLDSENMKVRIRTVLSDSLDCYCNMRKKELSGICEAACKYALKEFEEIILGIFVRIKQYEKRQSEAESNAGSGYSAVLRLEKLCKENESLKKKFMVELSKTVETSTVTESG